MTDERQAGLLELADEIADDDSRDGPPLREWSERLRALAVAQVPVEEEGLDVRMHRLPRFGVVDGAATPHPKGTLVRLDDVLRALAAAPSEDGS